MKLDHVTIFGNTWENYFSIRTLVKGLTGDDAAAMRATTAYTDYIFEQYEKEVTSFNPDADAKNITEPPTASELVKTYDLTLPVAQVVEIICRNAMEQIKATRRRRVEAMKKQKNATKSKAKKITAETLPGELEGACGVWE